MDPGPHVAAEYRRPDAPTCHIGFGPSPDIREWGPLVGGDVMAAARIGRVLHRGPIVTIRG